MCSFCLTAIGIGLDVEFPVDSAVFPEDSMQGDMTCINITIIDDEIFESNHTFQVQLTSIELTLSIAADPPPTIGSSRTTTITILDNDGM